eukprot:11157.XXX_9891_10217_1 [CDS] Oithona nana genome sequencing.
MQRINIFHDLLRAFPPHSLKIEIQNRRRRTTLTSRKCKKRRYFGWLWSLHKRFLQSCLSTTDAKRTRSRTCWSYGRRDKVIFLKTRLQLMITSLLLESPCVDVFPVLS